MVQDSQVAFRNLAELAGLNVIFDPDFRSSRISIELDEVDIYEALDILALETRSFWQPVNDNTILVAPDNQAKRRDYEEHILKTVYLANSLTTKEITDGITAMRTLLNMRFIAQSSSMNAIIMRDTADKIAIAEKIIEDLDKVRPGVLVEGVAQVGAVDRKLKFLRRIPVDQMTNSPNWGLQSYQDDQDSTAWGGQHVFDIYTRSDRVALDWSGHKDWQEWIHPPGANDRSDDH